MPRRALLPVVALALGALLAPSLAVAQVAVNAGGGSFSSPVQAPGFIGGHAAAVQGSTFSHKRDVTGTGIEAGASFTTSQVSGGDGTTVPVGVVGQAVVTGGSVSHAVGVWGWVNTQLGEPVLDHRALEGRCDIRNPGVGGVCMGVLGYVLQEGANNTGQFNYAGVFQAGNLTGVGTGTNIGAKFMATGGATNYNAIFGDGSTPGDQAPVLFQSYSTPKGGVMTASFQLSDTLHAAYWELGDSGLNGMYYHLRDAAGGATFTLFDANFGVPFSADSAGNLTLGKSVTVGGTAGTAAGTATADAYLTRKGTARRTAGTQIVDGTTGTASLPVNANATGKACALVSFDATHQVTKASWTSATSTQYTGCAFDGTWDLSATTTLWLDLGFDISATSNSVWVLVSSDATLSSYANYTNSANLYQNQPKRARGWIPVTMASLTPHGSPNLAAIKHIEIRIIRSSTATIDPIAMYVYGVWTDLSARPKIIITHDDGFANFYTYGYPYMKTAGIHGNLYINPSFVGTASYMTLANVNQMQTDGWSIGDHTWDHANLSLAPISSYTRSGTTATLVTSWAHGLTNGNSITIAGCDESEYNGARTVTVTNSTTVTFTTAGTNTDTTAKGWCYIQTAIAADKMRTEIRRAAEWLATNGFAYGGLHFAYPYGAWDPEVITALKAEGYVTARTITSTANGGSPWFQTFTGLGTDAGPWSLPAYAMDSSATSHTPTDILTQVDSAIANKGTIILYGHSINPTNGASANCTAASTPYPCCTGNGTGTGCASSTEQYLGDFQAVVDGVKLRCVTNNTCDVVSMSEWYNRL